MKLIGILSSILLSTVIQSAPTGEHRVQRNVAAGFSGSLALGGVKSVGVGGAAGAAAGGATSGAIAGSFSDAHSGSAEVEVIEHVKPQKTYVERTVIPNYVEKTIYEPSYVEKTIRVPTVVQKKVKVPAPPTVIEKTITAPHEVEYGVGVKEEIIPVQPVYVRKLKSKHRHHFHGHTFGGGSEGGYAGGSKAYSATLSHSVSPRLGEAIVNIPIATLNAVGGLLGTIAGGTSFSGSFSKSGGYAY